MVRDVLLLTTNASECAWWEQICNIQSCPLFEGGCCFEQAFNIVYRNVGRVIVTMSLTHSEEALVGT